MGHLITAAGTAGLIKVLEAMRHEQRPPTLHAEIRNPALSGSPLRVLHTSEPWNCEGPRIAGISAFGFGGNNAHLLVSEDDMSLDDTGAQALLGQEPLAIVAVGSVVGSTGDREALSRLLLANDSLLEHQSEESEARTREIELPLRGLRFPPNDLAETLPQQLALLAAACEAREQCASLPSNRTGVFVGMEPDAEVCRYGLRWRQAQRLRDSGLDPHEHSEWLQRCSDDIIPTLTSAGVVGTMPNIPANRLNSQLDLGGASYSISAGTDSGLRGLQLAARALRSGELDAALVAAVDLSCQEVHAQAMADRNGEP